MEQVFDPKRMVIVVTIEENADGESEVHEVPAVYEVCGRCNGRGVTDPPAFSNGFSREDFDADPDFEEAYFAGAYDVQCRECRGLRVVGVIAPSHADGLVAKLIEEWERDEAEYEAMCAMERRMGA